MGCLHEMGCLSTSSLKTREIWYHWSFVAPSDFLSDRFQRVVIDGCQSYWAPVLSGVPQGSILGPLLLILYVNDIPGFLSRPTVMFADDTLAHDSSSPTSTSNLLQESLVQVREWCLWRLRTNAEKCKSMKFTRARDPAACNYTMANKQLEQVKAHKYLGVLPSEDLSWKSHIFPVVAKSNKLLGLLKRTFGKRSKALLVGYKVMVRPVLEYPHQSYLIEKLERVRRNLTRWILGKDISYEERNKSLKLQLLRQ